MIKRKLIALGISAILLCSMGMSAQAQTSHYYFDLSGGTSDMTLKTYKDGGSAYEKNFYVTPTSFSRNQPYDVRAFRFEGAASGSPFVSDYKNVPYTYNGKKFAYTDGAYVPSNQYFFLRGYFVDGPTAQPIHVEGNYTP